MSDKPLILTVRGARGSAPSPGAGTVRYGGHTTCMDLRLSASHRLILDCGSGLRALQSDLPADPGPDGFRFDVFMTHYHTDHVEGLRFFRPLYDRRSRFFFHGFPWKSVGVKAALEGTMTPPWFPLRLQDTPSIKRFVDLTGESLRIEDVQVTPAAVVHPQGAAGYRLERDGRAIVFVTDREPGEPAIDAAVRTLAMEADVLIHDAQYTPEEYKASYRSWGHSSVQHALEMAREARVKRLVLFHHDPQRTDEELDHIVERARCEFPDVDAAREGMTFEL